MKKTIGVEVNENDTVAVTVEVNEDNGAIDVTLPEGRRFNTFEQWAIQDAIEEDAEIQDAIMFGEERARLQAEDYRLQVCQDWYWAKVS
jgi:hypothetical protein